MLVSTGSSFPYAAAALAPLGAQLHIYLPPKELGQKANTYSIEQLRTLGPWRGYWRGWNTLPFEMSGRIAPEYVNKMDGMLKAIGRWEACTAGSLARRLSPGSLQRRHLRRHGYVPSRVSCHPVVGSAWPAPMAAAMQRDSLRIARGEAGRDPQELRCTVRDRRSRQS